MRLIVLLVILQTVGCDHVLGSSMTEDSCGICGGSSACRHETQRNSERYRWVDKGFSPCSATCGVGNLTTHSTTHNYTWVRFLKNMRKRADVSFFILRDFRHSSVRYFGRMQVQAALSTDQYVTNLYVCKSSVRDSLDRNTYWTKSRHFALCYIRHSVYYTVVGF